MKENLKKFVKKNKYKLILGGALIVVVGGVIVIFSSKKFGSSDTIVVSKDILKKIWCKGVDHGFGIGVEDDTRFWKNFPEVEKAIEKVTSDLIAKNGTDKVLMTYALSYKDFYNALNEVLK